MGGTVVVQGQTYTSEEAGKNKKVAEQNAAKAAVKGLFPTEFANSDSGAGFGAQFQQMFQGAMPSKGQKRGREPAQDPKSKLMNAVQLTLVKNQGRQITKEDIQYKM